MRNLSSILKSVVLFFISLIIFLSLISYSARDISFLSLPAPLKINNIVGVSGAYLGFFLLFIFGAAAYFLSFYFLALALDKLKLVRFFGLAKKKTICFFSFLFFIVFLSAFIGLFSGIENMFQSCGLAGFFIAGFFKKYLGFHGAFITIFLLLTINALLLFGYFFVDVCLISRCIFSKLYAFLQEIKRRFVSQMFALGAGRREVRKPATPAIRNKEKEKSCPEIKVYTPKMGIASKILPLVSGVKDKKAADKEDGKTNSPALENDDAVKKFDAQNYILPKPSVIKLPSFTGYTGVKENIKGNIKNLEDTLLDFGVEVKVVSVQKGPVVTMYELAPHAGVKINRISALADDIALAMKSSSVRIVAPIPGKGTVGVEIPNDKKQLVFLREVLEEQIFTDSESKLTLIIGKDVSGNPIIANLKEMPHLLIAGTTGSGKTVCVNALISSILFKARPDEVKFILIDPKRVELAPFGGIPHLIHPIISEAKKAFVALNWAVEEMQKRYQILAREGARNIDIYNRGKDKMPYIVIIVDELADLMVVARENIEAAIQRLAQLSRAVGIHLILATQRPSVDVITGVIKANFPARISFKVASKVDSRTVLDAMGADKLLGKGDLLFLKPGAVKLIRAQGAFIDDEDIDSLTGFLRRQGAPVYENSIIEGAKRQELNLGSDELFDDAVKVVLGARQASASLLQRRLRVGYTRAARLLDLMEASGIVGPFCGSKAREILVDTESFYAEKGVVEDGLAPSR